MHNKAKHAISLGLLLSVLWLSLSGHYTLLLLSCGLLAVVLIVVLALRMGILDSEDHPLHLNIISLLSYCCWLLKEIFVSNIYVCRLILNPRLPINPKVIRLRSSQSSELARFIFTNSITLTPSTLTIDVDDDNIEVHALTEQSASVLSKGMLDRKVTAVESGSGG